MSAFLVEDGTGLTASNSFVSVAVATAFLEQHIEREAWKCISDVQKEIALRFATQYLNLKWRWFGNAFNPAAPQALQWPRTKYIDEFGTVSAGTGGVPVQIEQATALLALELAKSSSFQEGADDLTAEIQAEGEVRSFTVDTLSVDFQVGQNIGATLFRSFVGKRFPEIELLVASLGDLKGIDHLMEATQR